MPSWRRGFSRHGLGQAVQFDCPQPTGNSKSVAVNGSMGRYLRMRKALSVLSAGLFLLSVSAWAQSNACDLNGDGKVDATDVQSAINMSLGLSGCSANVYGANVCNVVMVQRVINASLG